MKIKEILILCIIITCCIFSLQAISAADDANTSDDMVLTSTDVSAYSLPNLDDQLQSGSGEAGSFSDLKNDTKNGGSITLDKNYTYSSSLDSDLAGGIVISKDTTIDGQGIVTIDANSVARVFNVAGGTTVTLKGITFINANPSTGDGGSIFATGTVHIDNCIFINNTANNANGGAVSLNGFGSTITDSYFEGNKAIKNPNNVNSGDAGAVFIDANNTIIRNSIFTENNAGLDGGAIRSSANHIQNCTITNCTLINNTANGSAGGVGMQSGNFHIYDSTFKYNEAKGMFDIYPGNGGGLIMRGWDSYAYNCTFIGNIAKQHGGAAFSTNTSFNPLNNNTGFELCTFIDNTAGYNGGAVDWAAGATYGYIKDSIFINNTAKRSGGAIHWSGHYGTISNSTFINNNATGEVTSVIGGILGGGDGGAVVWVGSHGIINDSCNFTNNYAKNRGGAIYLHGNATENCTNVTVYSSVFVDNFAGINGGAVDWHEGSHDGAIYNSKFENNIAGSNGGAVFWSGHHGEIWNSNFTNNTAKGLLVDEHGNIGDGGAVIWSGINGTVENCRFIDNEAIKNSAYDFGGRGGAVYLQNCTHGNCENTTFNNVYFEGNIAGTNGGAVDWHDGSHDGAIYNSKFENNIAGSNGGAVFWSGHHGEIWNSNFTNNTAKGLLVDQHGNIGDGGAVIWSGINGTVENCRFIDNEAIKNSAYDFGGRGGAVYLQNCTHGNCENTTFNNVYFEGNIAGTNGGAVDWHEGARDGLVNGSTFINNTARRSGGAIFWNGHNGTVQYSKFYNNSALGLVNAKSVSGEMTYGGDGGAIMWSGPLGDVEKCNFVNNTASNRGGAIYLQGSETEDCYNTTFIDSYFANNVAGSNGGAIDWHEGAHYGLLDNVTFVNNTARRSGGAIFWHGENGTVKNSKFFNNRATGEKLQYDMTLTMENVIVVNDDKLPSPSPSDSDIGKLYVLNYTDGSLRVFESYVADDSTGTLIWLKLDESSTISTTISPKDWAIDQFFGGDGGSILWGGDIGIVDNCIFIDSNSARRGGGAYMIGSDNVTFTNCYFENSTSGTNGGGVDWLAGANYGKVINSTFNNTRAARSAGAIYYDGWYGEMINITIINTKAWGGSLKESDDGLVKYAGWDSSHWDTNTTGGDAGAIMITGSHIYIYNATFINNTAVGRGGAVFLQDNHNITFDLCTFEDNNALGTANNTYNDPRDVSSGLNLWKTGLGGAVGFDLGASNGTIKNSKFINNTAARDGGAISFAYGSSGAHIYNSTFDNNTAKRSGGAFAWNGKDGIVSYCNFTNNAALGDVIDTEHANITSLSQVIHLDMLPVATGETTNKLYVLVTLDDDGNAIGYSLYVTVPKGDNGYEWLLHVETNVTDPSPTDWAIDEYFGGDGGSILWGGDHGLIDNCIFIDSNSARRGGGAYMLGSDHVTVSNSYFENCTSGTNGGGLDWLAGANYGRVINSTFNNTRAARSAGAIYYDGDYGEMINITVINATAFGGLLKESKDGKVKYAGWDSSHWDTNTTGGDAGAIMITGDHVFIYDATFTDCTAVGRGGAVFLQDNENATFDLCIFENNKALGTANNTWKNYTQERDDSNPDTRVNYDYTGHGGAIAFDFGANDCLIEDSVFINNTGRRDGGAVNFASGALNNIINNTKFINNSAGDDGGAINWEGNGGAIENITCYNNMGTSQEDSSSRGGTICLTGSDVVISKSNFTISTILRGDTLSINKLDGGTLFITGNNVNITDTVFCNSSAIHYGGTIYIIGNSTLIENCSFEQTDAIRGGTIYVEGDAVTINDSTFIKSNATEGGAIYIAGDDATINNTAFSNINASGDGGVLYVMGRNGKLYNSNFTDNFAGENGGAVYWQGYNGFISGSRFENNKAIGSGDRVNYIEVYNPNTGVTEKRYDITGGDGGAIMLKGSHTVIENSTFYQNTAEYCGGAIYLIGVGSEECTNITFKDCNFTENLAKMNGGAVDWASGASNAIVIGSYFINNTAYRSAGAIYVSGNYLDIEDTKFISNEATKQTTYDNRTSAGIFSSEGGNAGAICWMGSYGTVDNGTFIDNTAKVRGGAIQLERSLNATIKNSYFENNSAGTDGGAIDWYLGAYNGKINNTEFINNHANENGGTIYIEGSDNVVSYSRFYDGYAGIDGGAIYVTGNDVNITHSVFRNFTLDSVTGENGGAIYIVGNDTNILNCSFEDTHSPRMNGGAIYVEGENAVIDGSSFADSSAVLHGGAIYISGDNTTVRNSSFTGSTVSAPDSEGGAIYVSGENAVIDGSSFADSSAMLHGGAIYIEKDNAIIKDSSFTHSSVDAAESQGGAIYVFGENAVIDGSSFDDSIAKYRGGAIYIQGKYASVIDSTFNKTFAKSNSGYKTGNCGGAIFIDGYYAKIEGSKFDSAGAYRGGAIYLQGSYCNVTNSSFDNSYASWDGGAIYSTGSYSNVYNSNFTNNTAEYDGGAIFWFGGGNSQYNVVDGCIFKYNVAHASGGDAGGTINNVDGFQRKTRGGGAVYWSQDGKYGALRNCQFYYNSVQSAKKADGGAVLWDQSYHGRIINCTFVGNYVTTTNTGDVWVQGGAMYLRARTNFTVSGCEFINSSSSKEAGAMYLAKVPHTGTGTDPNILIENTRFINNVAEADSDYNVYGGGAVQIKDSDTKKVTFRNVEFINNTANNGGAVIVFNSPSGVIFEYCTFIGNNATQYGGAIWADTSFELKHSLIANNTALNGGGLYTTKAITNDNLTFENNKAFNGSAIYSTVDLTLNNAVILKNRANSSTFEITKSKDTGIITIDFYGWDNYLNGIFMSGNKALTVKNVTYWNESGIVNTGSDSRTISPKHPAQPTLESGQNFTIELGNDMGIRLNNRNYTFLTDADGHIEVNMRDILDEGVSIDEIAYIDIYLTNENYYTYVELFERQYPEFSASTTNATFHMNGTVSVNLPRGARSNVSVYIYDQFMGNITLDDDGNGTIDVSTLINGKYLEVGSYPVLLKYAGDGQFRPTNTTTVLNVTKAESRILFNITPYYYDFIINVTVEHYDTGIITDPNDVTGTVTLNVRGQIINVQLVNGTGIGIAYNMPPGAVKIEATYSGDDNYNPSSNFTYQNITERIRTLVDINITTGDIMVDETVFIEVTVISNQTVEGNITIILDNIEYNVTLNNSKAVFNKTGLPAGPKIVTAIFAGNETFAPSSDYAHFNVFKYDATVLIDAKNITHGSDEVIIITVPSDVSQGTINVTINGTEFKYKHILEIINGTVEIDISNLNVDTYNIIAFFESPKYKFTTNSSIFKVSKLKPPIVIDVDDVVYGNNTVIFVEVVGAVGGNVTLKINDTLIVFENVTLVNDTAIFTVRLPVGNYTIDVIYSGDESDLGNTAQSEFKVFKADPTIDISVKDILFGEREDVTISVNAAGNVTIKLDGIVIAENVTLDENNKTSLRLDNLRTGKHTIEVSHSGNDNFNPGIGNAEFNVNSMDTKLYVVVDNIFVWDTAHIEVRVLNNGGYLIRSAPGNVTVNVNGINYTEKIVDGIATFNVPDLSVGHKVVWAFYNGDGDLGQSKTASGFTVKQRTPDVSVTADNITTSENGKITVNIPSNATGYVIISGNFTNYQIRVDNFNQGIFELPIDKLAEGNYTVHIKYYGESYDNYTIAEDDCNFTVSRSNVTLDVAVENIVYGQKANITVTVPDGVTGTITLKLNDTDNRQITLPIYDNKVNWIVENLAAGNYTVNVTYNGNDVYNINRTSKAFNVTKAVPVLSIDDIVSVDAATNATIIVRINETATGNITITVNNTKYNATIENGVAVFVIDKLLGNTYNVIAEYIGDNNYTAANAVSADLVVTKVECYQINVTANDTKVDFNSTIVVRVPADAKGNVSIYINGSFEGYATVNDGVAMLNVTRPYGNYTVNATFSDGKYGERYAIADFWVFKHDSPLVIDADSILVDDIAYINVTAPSDNVTIEINGKSYTRKSYADGVAYFEVAGLEAGNKTVVAIYGGSSKYVRNSTTANFTVNKRGTDLKVTVVSPVNVGENATVTVILPVDAKGYAVVNVDGRNYTINLTAGQRSVEIPGLKNTTYKVNVTYLGDDKYLSSINNTQLIKVNKVPSSINLTVSENGIIAHGNDVNITIDAPIDATGKVIVKLLNGTQLIKSYTVYVNEGKGMLHLDSPVIGLYNVTAEYLGDDKYVGSENKTSFEVFATSGELNVNAPDIAVNVNNTVTVTIPGRHEGEVTIIISNESGVVITQNAAITPDDSLSHAELTLRLLDAGKYDVKAVFSEVNGTITKVYEGNDTFEVNKLASNIQIEEFNATISVGENETIKLTIDLDERANDGNISVFVNCAEYKTNTSKLTLEIPGLNADDYIVKVIYHGNNWYNESSANCSFKVVRNSSPMTVNVTNSTVGSVEQINVTLPDNATGQVLLDINGQHYYANVTLGIAQFNITCLKAGEYEFNVTYIGDYKYIDNNTSSILKVSKLQPVFAVNGNNIEFGSDELIEFETADNITGLVTVEIDNKNYTAFISEGKGNLTVYNLAVGTHNVTVYFEGDYKFLNASAKNNFTVSRPAPEIVLSVSNITYTENETVTVYVDAVGNVTLRIDEIGYSETVDLDGGKATFIISGLNAGNYTAEATFNQSAISAAADFTVFKADPTITLEVHNIVYGDVEHIIVHVNAEGNVTIRVNGTEETIVLRTDDSGYVILRAGPQNGISSYDGKAHEYIYNLKPGEYPVEVTFNGNDNYNTASVSDVFYVSKANSTIKVDVENIDVGDVALINVTLPKNATGNVRIEINGKEYKPESFIDGVAKFKVENLTHGNKTVAVTYSGDDNYTANFTTANFTVSKITPEITVNVKDIDVGEKALIEVTAPDDVTNPVLVDVGGVGYYVNITGGKGELYVPNLLSGDYNATARYSGDEKYLSAENATGFKVSKVPSSVNVSAENITFGENAVINVETPEDLLGNVTVSVDGENYTVPVSGGKGVLVVPGLAGGPHNVDVIFNGSDKYGPSSNSTAFNVGKTKLFPDDIKVVDIGNGTVVVVVPNNATGNVTIKVEDKEFNAIVVNGTAVVNLDDVTPGEHEIEVIYSGDENYDGASVNSTAVAPKYDTLVNVTCDVVGDKAVISVTVPDNATGNVTVELDGVKYILPIEDGVATFEIDNLTVGRKTIVVDYSGDDNYVPTHTTNNITVSKLPSFVNATISDIKAGENVTVEVSVPENATGQVLIDIDGVGYYVNVTDGKGVVEIPNISGGKHNVALTYAGDDKYEPSSNSSSFNVGKTKLFPDEIKVIDQGNGTVVVVVPNDATGNITIKVEDKEFNATIVNGTAVVNLDDVTPGEHEIEVIYSGNDNYEGASVNSTAVAPKYDTSVDVTCDVAGDKAVISVTVPDNATGNVTIELDGVKYTQPIEDGVATFEIGNLTAGTKTIAVDYSGDDNYASNHTISNIAVSKLPSFVNATISDIKFGENVTVEVSVPENATGQVLIDIDGVGYYVNVTGGKGVVEIPNISGGRHDVALTYAGDDKYEPSSNSASFNVDKDKASPGDIKVIDQGNNTVVIVLPDDATGNVTVKVGDNEFNATVVNGTAVVKLENVTPGEHEIEVIYSGDDNYENATVDATVTVPRVQTPVSIDVDDIKVGDNATVKVNLPGDATGNVTLEIDAKSYTAPVINGVATFEVPDLIAGDKTVVAIYSGDDRYLSNYTTDTFMVSKRPASIDVVIFDIDVGENVTVIATLPRDATGQVLIDIDGVGYYANLTGGVGVANIPRIPSGVYNVNVTYVGDYKYLPNSTKGNFNVTKVKSFVIPSAEDIMVGDDEILKFVVPTDATGKLIVDDILLISLDTGNGYIIDIYDGAGELTVSGLPEGKYLVSVRYIGDEKYLPSDNSTTFIVSKRTADLDVVDYGNRTVVVSVPENATGTITIIIENQTYVANITDGKAVFFLENATPGLHDIKVIYSGDDAYEPSVVDSTAQIPKYETPVDVSSEDISVGDTETITVNLPEDAKGTVTVEIDGKTYSAEVVDGKAVFNIPGLTAGNKTATIKYSGDDNYEANETAVNFTVNKAGAAINVESEDIQFGDEETITINLPEDAKGTVTVEIDGEIYSANVTDGKAVFNIPGLTVGNKTAIVRYSGDDKYEANETAVNFTVNKCGVAINAVSEDIKVGDDETITVYFPKDATGRVILGLGLDEYYADIIDGKAVFTIPKLASGKYEASVRYEGDDKYLPNSTAVSFTVSKNDAPASATGDDIKIGDDGTVVVYLPSDATGTVTIVVDGKSYTQEVVNGKAVFKISGLGVGVHIVDVYYSGDDKYEANHTSTQIIVEDNSDNPDENESSIYVAEETILSKYPTGNPLLILVVMLIGIIPFRKFKKE